MGPGEQLSCRMLLISVTKPGEESLRFETKQLIELKIKSLTIQNSTLDVVRQTASGVDDCSSEVLN